jgi:DivIVA domain-containing protein
MARAEMRGNEPGKAQDSAISSEVATQAAELVAGRAKEDERPRRFGASRVLTAADRDRILKDARSVEFPAALRGYDRAAVDRYVERINRLITELEMSSSPEAAVRHALDEVSEETRDILQRAHDTAEEITARSRARADDRVQKAEDEIEEMREAAERGVAELRDTAAREVSELRETAVREVAELRDNAAQEVAELRDTAVREVAELRDTAVREAADARESAARESQRMRTTAQREAEETRETARREAEEMIEAAETRARELARSAEAIWRERRRLIDDMRGVGEQLLAIGETEGKRFPRFGEEGSAAVELLREPGAAVTAGLVTGHQTNGGSEVTPG